MAARRPTTCAGGQRRGRRDERRARKRLQGRRARDPHRRRVAEVRARHAQRAARPDAVGQDLADAAAGRARPADLRARAGRRPRRHRPACAQSLGRDGLPAVHQLPDADASTRTSPRRCASQAHAAGRDRPRVRAAADMLRLGPMLERTPLQLSGGQQQRCAIARAVVKGADLVLLDEPLANLDYKLREELREELPRIFAETGAIFVYATTEPTEALLLGGNTATLSEGRLVQFGPTVEVYRRPVDLRAAETFSDPPLNDDAGQQARRRSPPGLAASRSPPADCFAGLAGRALHARRCARTIFRWRSRAPARSSSCGVVDVTEITGSESYVHVHVGDAALGGARARRARDRARARRSRSSLDPRTRPRVRFRRGGSPARPAGLRRHAMARIDLVDLAHAYRPNPRPSRLRAEADDHDLAAWRRLCAARPLRLRQDHAAQHHFRPGRCPRAGRVLFDGAT